MTRAAAALRVSQSAVSKRIAALEARLGRDLVEADGRRVRLTAEGRRLVEHGAPLLAELRDLLESADEVGGGTLRMGVSESLLASWGAGVLRAAADAVPGLVLVLGAHRSPVAVDHVRSGEYRLALVAGPSDVAPDLATQPVVDEEMVIVPAGLERRRVRLHEPLDVITIEPRSGTWRAEKRQLGHLRREAGVTLRVASTLQSFPGIVQMAVAGFGHALAPRGIVAALGVPKRAVIRLPAPGLRRPITLVARRASFATALVSRFRVAVCEAAPAAPLS